jgi:hypothetical protein
MLPSIRHILKTLMKNLPAFRSIFSAVAIAAFFVSSRAHSAPGDLYVAEATGGGHIYKFTPAGDRSTFASGIYQPVALAFDRAGNLFVGNSGAGGCIPEDPCPPQPSTVIKILPDGTQSTFATLQSSELLDLAFDGAGNLFVSTGTSIVKIAPNGTQTTFASQLHGAWPMAFDTSGNLFVGLNPIGSSSIARFAPDGSSTTFVTFTGSSSFITGLAFGPGGDLYARVGSSILKISPDGSHTTFATNDRFKDALAFDASGVLFAGLSAYNSTEPAIVKFTSSGAATTFAFGPLLPSALAFEPVTEKIRNISARGLVGGGDNTLIGGFIIGGSALANNAVIVRALGPSLAGSGVANPLSDPVLELHDSSGAVIARNNDWQDTQKAQLTASGLAPTDPRESAMFATLPTGNYTAVVRSGDSTVGTAVVEVFSVSQ